MKKILIFLFGFFDLFGSKKDKSYLTLEQAINKKQELSEELINLRKGVTYHNTVIKGREGQDIKCMLNRIKTVEDTIIDLKIAIQRANIPILKTIYSRQNLKEEKKMHEISLSSLRKSVSEYGETEVNSVLSERYLRDQIMSIDRKIKSIDAKLKSFNRKTLIEKTIQ